MGTVILVIALLVVGCLSALAFTGLIMVNRRLNTLKRRLALLGGTRGGDLLSVVSSHVEATRHLDAHAAELEHRLQELQDGMSYSLQRIGVVRYDAFADANGELSYSVALLDEVGNGVLLTSLQNRTDGRLHVKQVLAGGRADVELSDEEQEAVARALHSGEPEPEQGPTAKSSEKQKPKQKRKERRPAVQEDPRTPPPPPGRVRLQTDGTERVPAQR